MRTTGRSVGAPYPTFAELSPIWRACLELAWEAQRAGSLPIAAVVTDSKGNILACGRNRLAEPHELSPHLPGTPYLTGSPLAHAEVNALLQLGYRQPGPRPLLYTTTEPCPLCMGASRMAGVGTVLFASRDPWAGCSRMADDVPYLKRSGPTAKGPEPALEAPLVAWQTAVHLSTYSDADRFLSVWEELMPEACSAGRTLHAEGSLDALAGNEAAAPEVWDVLVGALTEG